MISETIKLILIPLFVMGLKIFFMAISVEVDPILVNSIATGMAVWILIRLGLATVEAFMPKTVERLRERTFWKD